MVRSRTQATAGGGRLRFVAATAVYCVACWGLVYWGALETMGYVTPYPWIGAVVLELPVSLVLVGLYAVLSAMSVGETLGTVMGFVGVLALVVSPVFNVFILRRVWRRAGRPAAQ